MICDDVIVDACVRCRERPRSGRTYCKPCKAELEREYRRRGIDLNAVCDLCKHPETAMSRGGDRVKALTRDHDHATDIFRGNLCHACNLLVGWMERAGVEVVEAAVVYLGW